MAMTAYFPFAETRAGAWGKARQKPSEGSMGRVFNSPDRQVLAPSSTLMREQL
jgi:hypothetical protein